MSQPQDFSSDYLEAMPAVRARVPEHARLGVFSTGMIVMTGAAEFILDFVQNLGRPHQIVARVIVPHLAMPQFIDALSTNIDLYRQRFGNLPSPRLAPHQEGLRSEVVQHGMQYADPHAPGRAPTAADAASQFDTLSSTKGPASPGSDPLVAPSSGTAHSPGQPVASHPPIASHAPAADTPPGDTGSASPTTSHDPVSHQPPPRRPTAQEVYDDLKLPDDLLNGKYANAVMIGHGPNEFSFDFITNFYPQSAVSCRVFVGAGQAPRLLDSMRTAWDQLRPRYFPPNNPPNQSPPMA